MFCQALALPGLLGCDPCFVFSHKAVDISSGGADRGPDYHLTFPCHL